MKRLILVLAILLLLPSVVFGVVSGNDLKNLCFAEKEKTSDKVTKEWLDVSCMLYVQGTILGWKAGMIMGSRDEMADKNNGRICISENSIATEWASIVTKYLKSHPEKLHQPATFMVIMAMEEAFPCKNH